MTTFLFSCQPFNLTQAKKVKLCTSLTRCFSVPISIVDKENKQQFNQWYALADTVSSKNTLTKILRYKDLAALVCKNEWTFKNGKMLRGTEKMGVKAK